MNESHCQIHFILTTNKLLIALLHKIAQFSKCLFINNLDNLSLWNFPPFLAETIDNFVKYLLF